MLTLALVLFSVGRSFANPAPPPALVSPAIGATNVDPDPTLTWRWVDDLLANGGFEAGLAPWYTGGSNPSTWQVNTTPTNKWATSTLLPIIGATGQLIQDFVIPPDATSATLQWKERVWNLIPSQVIGRHRVLLYENGSALLLLVSATGSESIYTSHNWVSHSTNLLAYAGRTLQVVVQAEALSGLAGNNWYSDVDAFSFSCEHPTMPDFQIYAGKDPALTAGDLLGGTNDVSFSSVALLPFTTYYWKVSSIRDGVTNYSTVSRFTTGQRVLQPLTILNVSDVSVRVRFPTRLNRFYTVEQIDTIDGSSSWHDASRTYGGTGDPLELLISPSPGDSGFYRLRITP